MIQHATVIPWTLRTIYFVIVDENEKNFTILRANKKGITYLMQKSRIYYTTSYLVNTQSLNLIFSMHLLGCCSIFQTRFTYVGRAKKLFFFVSERDFNGILKEAIQNVSMVKHNCKM